MATDSPYVTEQPVVAAPIATDDSASGPLTIQNPIAKLAIGTFAVLAAVAARAKQGNLSPSLSPAH